MMDYGSSSNVNPFKVCEKLNVKHEQSNIQIIQFDRFFTSRLVLRYAGWVLQLRVGALFDSLLILIGADKT
jgi:hypothetical protein